MPKTQSNGRDNQRLRARKDILQAAARLLRQGRKPTMEEVAAEAMVSRATAYRYFPNLEAMLVEAPLDGDAPDPAEIFKDTPPDPAARIDKAEAALHDMCYRNETSLRLMMIQSLERSLAPDADRATPLRQNRRSELIHAALAPARPRLKKSSYDRLSAALSLILGTESMIVFRDVLPLTPTEARKVKSWAVRTLVQAALEESRRER